MNVKSTILTLIKYRKRHDNGATLFYKTNKS